MLEWPPREASLKVRPMTDEEAARLEKVLEASKELGKRILAHRKGKPVPSSTPIISQARDEYP